MLSPDEARAALNRLRKERGYSYAALSRAIGRNTAYIQQYLFRGSPVRLEERDRRKIAAILGCDERDIGGPDHTKPTGSSVVHVKRLAVEVSAGSGSIIDKESSLGYFSFPRSWLRRVTNTNSENLSIIHVKGDSMAPTLVDGDEAIVDEMQKTAHGENGIYVLRRDDTLMVKRLTLTPGSGLLTISSDNPSYPTWHNCPICSLNVIGRVVGKVSRVR